MPSEDPYDLVRLAAAANPFQAHLWQQAPEEEGQVLGDYLDAGIGDFPGIRAEVWAVAKDIARARAIIRDHQRRSEKVFNPMKTRKAGRARIKTRCRMVTDMPWKERKG